LGRIGNVATPFGLRWHLHRGIPCLPFDFGRPVPARADVLDSALAIIGAVASSALQWKLYRETLANLSTIGHLRGFSDQPVAEIVQCGEPILSTTFGCASTAPKGNVSKS
jgi:hypothetical protein